MSYGYCPSCLDVWYGRFIAKSVIEKAMHPSCEAKLSAIQKGRR